MRTNNQRWQLLADKVKQQNEETKIRCLREFMKLTHVMHAYISLKFNGYGINRTQRRIIYNILSHKKPMTPTEISKRIPLTIDTINKSIDNLDKMGLTRSYHSKKDRRIRMVTLTEKALELFETNLPLRHEALSQSMDCFSEGEIETLTDYLQRLLEQINYLMEQVESNGNEK